MFRKRSFWILLLIVAAIVVVVVVRSRKPVEVAEKALPAPVAVAQQGDLTAQLQVAGQFIPYQNVAVHAKVAGYVRWIKVDIGDIVHTNEVMAKLEVPELRDQLAETRAAVQHAQAQVVREKDEVAHADAAYRAIHLNYTRLAEAAKERPGLIAQQEIDDYEARDLEAAAKIDVSKAAYEAAQQQLSLAKSNEDRVNALYAYTDILSPFNGVVTFRYADTGALVQAGTDSNTQAMPVVSVAQSDLLRLRMPVPESDVPYIDIGGHVDVHVDSTGEVFPGKIIRFTRQLDPSTRTMLTEVDVPNPTLKLTTGMYAETTFYLKTKPDAIYIPAQCVVTSGNIYYILVLDSTNHVVKRNVKLGIQTPNRIEIIDGGLKAGEKVIAAGQDNYREGDLIDPQPAFIPTPAQEEGK